MKSNLITTVTFFLLPLCLFAQQHIIISYNSFIENVKKNNPVVAKAHNVATIGEMQYSAARGHYDPLLNSSTENKYYNSTGYYNLFSGSIKQPLFTSQYIKMGYEYGAGVYINPEQYTPSYGLPYLGFEFSLLQGLLIDKRRAEVLKSKNYLSYSVAEQNSMINDLLYVSSQAYFDWMYTQKQYALYSYFLELSVQRLNAIENLANSGERPSVDTIEAAILVQGRLLEQQSSAIENRKKLNELTSFNWQSNDIPNTETTNYITSDSLESCFEKAKQMVFQIMRYDSISNPIVLQYQAKQAVLEVEKRLKKEMIKPKLDVMYNFLSANTNSSALIFSPNNYKWGANLSFPLFLRNARNEYKVASLNAKNNTFDLNNKINEIALKQNYLKQALLVLNNQLVTAQKTVDYSKQLLLAEKLKFDNGESSLFMINTRESKLLESELKLADYKLKFAKCVLGIIYLNGNLEYSF